MIYFLFWRSDHPQFCVAEVVIRVYERMEGTRLGEWTVKWLVDCLGIFWKEKPNSSITSEWATSATITLASVECIENPEIVLWGRCRIHMWKVLNHLLNIRAKRVFRGRGRRRCWWNPMGYAFLKPTEFVWTFLLALFTAWVYDCLIMFISIFVIAEASSFNHILLMLTVFDFKVHGHGHMRENENFRSSLSTVSSWLKWNSAS